MSHPFVHAARAQTMLRDFDRHRKAIPTGDFDKIQDTWDKCERWVDLIPPNGWRDLVTFLSSIADQVSDADAAKIWDMKRQLEHEGRG